MKTYVFSIIQFLFLVNHINGQFRIDAGRDTIYCYTDYMSNPYILGGNPTASGGTEPYTYTWSLNNSVSANHYLDDATAANPKIISFSEYPLNFKLSVFDSSGNKLTDSVIVRTDIIMLYLLGYVPIINKGDTIPLDHNDCVIDGIKPYTYYWSPDYNISNVYDEYPDVWPDTTTFYTFHIIDSIGCSVQEDVLIRVNTPSSIHYETSLTNMSLVYPNPTIDYITINIQGLGLKDFEFKIINTEGRIIKDGKINGKSQIDINSLTKGVYIICISDMIKREEYVTRFIKK